MYTEVPQKKIVRKKKIDMQKSVICKKRDI